MAPALRGRRTTRKRSTTGSCWLRKNWLVLHRAGGAAGLLVVGFALLAGGCDAMPESECVAQPVARLDAVDPEDETLPFGFPLRDLPALTRPVMTRFCEHKYRDRDWGVSKTFHAAEDFGSPPGTEVYAVADGEVVYSGPMGGYGWLIIVDHPEMNLYSLYGHLSPKRWEIEPGPVAKGELIGHLGDADENGGTPDDPLVPHLHFGMRAGQRADYPGRGAWRWMMGWTGENVTRLGWMRPSAVIAGQTVPAGGFQSPQAGLWEKWGSDLLLFGLVSLGLVAMGAVGAIKRKPALIVSSGTALLMVCILNFIRTGPSVAVLILSFSAIVFIVTGVHSQLRSARDDRRSMKQTSASLPLIAVAVLLAGCSTSGEAGHTFETIEENGVPVAVSSAIPKFAGELFEYEQILAIRPDPDNPDTLLYRPSSFTLGDDDLYYVADTGNHRIVVFDGEGRFVHAFGREGEGPGELLNPVLVEVDDGVASVFGEGTSRFRCDGTFIDVVDSGRLARYADDGTLVVEGTTRQTAEDGSRTFGAVARLLDDNGGVLAEVESGHAPSATWMQYKGAPSVFALPGNEILATAGVEPTVDYYGTDGRLKRRVRIELAPQPIGDADMAAVDEVWNQFLDDLEATGRGATVDHMLELKGMTSYPDTKAFWGRPIVEDSRWLWLPYSVPVMGVSSPGSKPVAAPARFRVVDGRGEFIGTTNWPPEVVKQSGARIIHGHLLAMVWDDEAEEMVPTVYRIRPRIEGLIYP